MLWKHHLALAICLGAPVALAQNTVPPVVPLVVAVAADTVLPLEATVNGAPSGTWAFVERAGVLYAPREATEEWRVQVRPTIQPITVRGTEYVALAAIPGFASKINFANQSIDLTFAPPAFAVTKLSTELSERPRLSKVLPSLFLNYDFNYSAGRSRTGPATSDMGVVAELGASSEWGVFTSTHVGRNLSGTMSADMPSRWLRLETTLTRDIPDLNRTLRLGDTATRAGMRGRSVYFGGVQYATNYALTPGFLSRPLPIIRGVSSAPSTVDLYVNDVLRQTSSVPAGPFAIENAATLTGSGEARLVVRDLLGREVVTVQPFFTAVELLAAGLSDWSVEAGRLRRDLGLASGNYGDGFASGTILHGWTDGLTFEVRGATTRHHADAGIGVISALPGGVLGKGAVAISRNQALENGRQLFLGLQRSWLRSTAQIQMEGSSRGFRNLGDDPGLLPARFQAAGNFTYATENLGAFGLGFARITRYDALQVTTISANYTIRVGRDSSLNVNLNKVLGQASGTSVSASLLVPLEDRTLLNATVGSHGSARDYFASASKTPDGENGLGWRALAGVRQDTSVAEGGVYYSGRHGRVFGDLSVSSEQTAMRAGAAGGLLFASNQFFASPRLDGSFAIAEVAGYGDVGIGLGSNVLSRTDGAGVA
ncbi:MAG: fimbria/pilus outer membrane usher protein, partial [Pseudomonadota bacterium]|nr:fimbria/pilus outer membrane usher protein [Pseudomonadota bacterium]